MTRVMTEQNNKEGLLLHIWEEYELNPDCLMVYIWVEGLKAANECIFMHENSSPA